MDRATTEITMGINKGIDLEMKTVKRGGTKERKPERAETGAENAGGAWGILNGARKNEAGLRVAYTVKWRGG